MYFLRYIIKYIEHRYRPSVLHEFENITNEESLRSFRLIRNILTRYTLCNVICTLLDIR